MNSKPNIWLALLLMVTFAATRYPGLMPPNFSAAYALLFCAGVYLPGSLGWWLPLATMAGADACLAVYYWNVNQIPFQWYQLANYLVYALLIAFGRGFKPASSWGKLLAGGVMGALLFYLVTNTVSWLLNPFGNPEYTRDWVGWWIALTQGTAGHPPTWEFLRNSLLSGGLFTGLFVGAMKLSDHLESAAEKEAAETPVPEPVDAPEQPEESHA